MAKVKLSQATYVERGYGQVEPNHLSARQNGQIYAQLPAKKGIAVLENGQFAKYDYATGEVNFTGAGEWMLVFNEVKLYEPRQTDADFAMIADNYVAAVYNADGALMKDAAMAGEGDVDDITDPVFTKGTTMVPRLLKTNVGDIFTTNMINVAEPEVGTTLSPNANGILDTATGDAEMVWTVVKVYTMPDNQKGVKLQRTK